MLALHGMRVEVLATGGYSSSCLSFVGKTIQQALDMLEGLQDIPQEDMDELADLIDQYWTVYEMEEGQARNAAGNLKAGLIANWYKNHFPECLQAYNILLALLMEPFE